MPSLKSTLALLTLVYKYLPLVIRTTITHVFTRPRLFAAHKKTYTLHSPESVEQDPKIVLVIGGSFSGFHLVHLLANSLPSGYVVVLVERNSHFNYTFNFPRFSVIGEGEGDYKSEIDPKDIEGNASNHKSGRVGKAFIPFDGHMASAPTGIYRRVMADVTELTTHSAVLSTGETINFSHLVLATGAAQSPPAKLLARTKRLACAEIQTLQSAIVGAKKIALVGGGAVGVQLAGDIKSFFPSKEVVLVHSRQGVLTSFESEELSLYVQEKLAKMGVRVILGERPVLGKETVEGIWGAESLRWKDGALEEFDLVIPCTGQTPNSSLISSLSPSSLSATTSRILVTPTLQVQTTAPDSPAPSLSPDTSSKAISTTYFPHILAIGDVAETGGPKMARAGMMQAEVAWENILALIAASEGAESKKLNAVNKKSKLREYVPVMGMEGILKLSLGKDENVTFVPDAKSGGYLFPGKSSNVELEVDRTWAFFGADLATAGDLDA